MNYTINGTKYTTEQPNPYSNEWQCCDENYDAEHDGIDWCSDSMTGSGTTSDEALMDLLEQKMELQLENIQRALESGLTTIEVKL